MTTIRLPANNWRPRWYQKPLWLYLWRGGDRAVSIWHRRAGKDDVCLHWTAVSAHRKIATYWHMLPQASQARKAIWEAVNPHTGKRRIDEAFPLGIRDNTRENEMMIRFKNGSTWQVVGSDNYNSLVGSPPYGVVFSEWALADPASWAYIRPIIKENGGWALFITTPRGDNHARASLSSAKRNPKWFGEVLRADNDTDVFTTEDLEEELQGYIDDYGEDQGRSFFEQEYLCSFEAAILGAYFSTEIRKARQEGRITDVPIDPILHVNTYWDLGIDDSMTIWFVQETGRETRFVDYYELSGEGLQHYVNILDEKAHKCDWTYGFHVAPHDIKVRELTTGKSRYESAKEMGITFQVTPRPEKKEDSIEAARRVFHRCWFDQNRCSQGINALSNYRKEFDEKNKVFGTRPVHDWSSHGADAFQTYAMRTRKYDLPSDI